MAKAKKAKGENGEGPAVAKLAYDNYIVMEMNRTELAAAPYNPRVISDEEKRRLKGILKRHGLVAPPTWNKRSGVLVAGHQRLSQLDAIHGSPNYTLQVAVIDVDEKTEKELNVALNNPQSQGDWDLEKLGDILKDSAIDLSGTGFDMADVFQLFGDNPAMSNETTEAMADKLRELKEKYRSNIKKAQDKGDDNFYLVVVFRDYADRLKFLNGFKMDDNRYQSGARILERLDEASGTRKEVVPGPSVSGPVAPVAEVPVS